MKIVFFDKPRAVLNLFELCRDGKMCVPMNISGKPSAERDRVRK